MDHSMQTNFSEAGSEGILKNFLLKMPLIDIETQGGSLSNKQIRNLKNTTIYKKEMVYFQD